MKLKQSLLMPLSFLFALLILLAYYNLAVKFVDGKRLKFFPYEKLYSFRTDMKFTAKEVLPHIQEEVLILDSAKVDVLNPKFDFKLARMDRPDLEWMTKVGQTPVDRILKPGDPYYSEAYDYIRKADEDHILSGTWYTENLDSIKRLDETVTKQYELELKALIKSNLDAGRWTKKEADEQWEAYKKNPARFLATEPVEEKKQPGLTDFLKHLWKSGEGKEDIEALLFLCLNYSLIYYFALNRRRRDFEVHLQFGSYWQVLSKSLVSFLHSLLPNLVFFSLLAWVSATYFGLPLTWSSFLFLFGLLLFLQLLYYGVAYGLAVPVKRYRKEA